MSDLLSPLKSPTPAIRQSLPIIPAEPPPILLVPFSSHMSTSPLLFRHRMSDLPSPLKSPTRNLPIVADNAERASTDQINPIQPSFVNFATVVPPQDVGLAVGIEVANPSNVPVVADRAGRASTDHLGPVHKQDVDFTGGVPPQDVGLAVTVEVANPGNLPIVADNAERAGTDHLSPVHQQDVDFARDVAPQDVGLAVAVEIGLPGVDQLRGAVASRGSIGICICRDCRAICQGSSCQLYKRLHRDAGNIKDGSRERRICSKCRGGGGRPIYIGGASAIYQAKIGIGGCTNPAT